MSSQAPRMPNPNRCRVCGGILAPPKGVTYLAQRQQWIKIGRTSGSVARRIKVLTTTPDTVITPAEMNLAASLNLITVIDRDVEHKLHEQFAEHHAAGEWFTAAPVLAWLLEQR